MAYDVARHNVVLFGGRNDRGDFLGQTWIWSGKSWTEVRPSQSPANRALAAMAYDAGNEQIVLFGGQNEQVAGSCPHLRDTWTWNGRTWAEMMVAVSPDLCEAVASYDDQTRTVLLFGFGAGGHAETWSWNGTVWAQLHPASEPQGRQGASLTYDTASGTMLLFGGFNQSSGLLNDTWLWNGVTWSRQQPAVSPAPREGSLETNLGASGRTILYGGLAGNVFLNDTWLWDGSTWTLVRPATTPPQRAYGTAAYDPTSNHALIFGGVSTTNPNWEIDEMWTWTGTDWQRGWGS